MVQKVHWDVCWVNCDNWYMSGKIILGLSNTSSREHAGCSLRYSHPWLLATPSNSYPRSMARSSRLAPITNSIMPDTPQSGYFACRDGLQALVLEAVHFFLGGVVLFEDDPEKSCGDERCDGETSWIRVSKGSIFGE